jgi:predicted molibdopterin-dependent oxidoreductase YjgC
MISDGEMIKVISRRGEIIAKAEVTDRTVPGVVFTTFHFKEAAANMLTIAALDPIAGIPEFKACAVRVERI